MHIIGVSSIVVTLSDREEVNMACKKPENMTEEAWNQHLKWLDLVDNEFKANELKRRREERRNQSGKRNPEDVVRPPA
jgi:hypothetical protein